MEKHRKESWGIGSLSLLIAVFAVVFNFMYIRGETLGQHLFNTLGFSITYDGLIGIILFLLSLFLGSRYKEHYLAPIGALMSKSFLILFLLLAVIGAIQHLFF
ncbi:hypothetical protein M3231_27265 [Neobacillus mesonae]|nr:hypothetical protein [Neobacillus mesonae]